MSKLIKEKYGALKTDKQGHVIFESPEQGFAALKEDIRAKLTGATSSDISARTTLKAFGKVYAEDPNWPKKVALLLGVTPDTTMGDILIDHGIDDLIAAIARQEGFYATQ